MSVSYAEIFERIDIPDDGTPDEIRIKAIVVYWKWPDKEQYTVQFQTVDDGREWMERNAATVAA